MHKRNIRRVIRSAASCCYGEMHFSNASDAWDSLAIWRFGDLVQYRLFIRLILSILRNIGKCTFYIFSEGEVEDDERPEEACAST